MSRLRDMLAQTRMRSALSTMAGGDDESVKPDTDDPTQIPDNTPAPRAVTL